MIVKVQMPLEANHASPPWYVYPKGKLWEMFVQERDVPEAVKRAVKVNRGKAYFNATKNDKGGLDFGVQAPSQDW